MIQNYKNKKFKNSLLIYRKLLMMKINPKKMKMMMMLQFMHPYLPNK
jgi:hypothetical protein